MSTQQQTVVAPDSTEAIHRVGLRSFMEKQEGRFVTVEFTKQDGSHRVLNGRLGVVAPSKGGDNKVEADHRPYLTVFDVKAAGYRTVDLSTVGRVRAQGREYTVIG